MGSVERLTITIKQPFRLIPGGIAVVGGLVDHYKTTVQRCGSRPQMRQTSNGCDSRGVRADLEPLELVRDDEEPDQYTVYSPDCSNGSPPQLPLTSTGLS